MKHESVYMFDVDGVLCEIASPISRDVAKLLARLLNEEAYVLINTGRGYDRIHGEVVSHYGVLSNQIICSITSLFRRRWVGR